MQLERSPLADAHEAAGAKMVPFGGWEMPLSYPTGTIAEHNACRADAAVFDVSHLGTVRVVGPGARDHLQRTLTNDLDKISPGRCQYTHLLGDDGSVLDDIIVWWRGGDSFDVMPNASNTDRVVGALSADVHGLTAVDVTAQRAVLAVQGPRAVERLAQRWPVLADIRRFHVATVRLDGVDVVAAGTGYTGEAGIELAVPVEAAHDLWNAVVELDITPAGLGARDTLRLEAGLPLHGHELAPGITPLHAGLGWVVGWDKPEFCGRDALIALKEHGLDRCLIGLRTAGRRPPREGDAVRTSAGEVLGSVTSGNYSPTLGVGIAMAFVPPEVGVDTEVAIVGRSELAATVVTLPFVSGRPA